MQCPCSTQTGPVLLRMGEHEWLQLLNINCNTIVANHNRGQVNEQSHQDESKRNKI